MDTRLELYQKIIAVYYENGGIYGAPKIAGVLNKSGIKCSVSTVSRAMKLLGIMSIVPKRFRRKASSMTPAEKKLIVNLVKDMDYGHIVHQDGQRRFLLSDHIHRYIFKSSSRMGT